MDILKRNISQKKDILNKLLTHINLINKYINSSIIIPKPVSSIKCDDKNNKISFQEGTFKKIEYTYGIFVIDDKIIYEFNILLGKGTFGSVKLYNKITNNTRYPDFIVIKMGSDATALATEKQIIELLEKNNTCNNFITNAKYLQTEDVIPLDYVIMEYMDGTLINLINKNYNDDVIIFNNANDQMLFKLIKIISQATLCLVENGLYYTDIKCDNILYRCKNDNDIEIMLGDLGSICEKGKNKYMTATYTPIDRQIKTKHPYYVDYNDPKESDVVWGIGVMYLELLGYNIIMFGYEIVKLVFNLDAQINNLLYSHQHHDSVKEHMEIIKKMLTMTAEKRITLKELIILLSSKIT